MTPVQIAMASVGYLVMSGITWYLMDRLTMHDSEVDVWLAILWPFVLPIYVGIWTIQATHAIGRAMGTALGRRRTRLDLALRREQLDLKALERELSK